MQKLFFFCVFIILTTMMSAQDKIITVEQDTIECRIVSIGAEQINYEQKFADGYVVGKSIPTEQVATYFRSSQSSSSIFSWRPVRPWLFRINAGGSWMPWLYDAVEDAPATGGGLSRGFHLNASGHYLLTPAIGAGLQYSFFHSKIDDEYPVETYSYYPTYSMMSNKEKQYVNYIGASFIFRQFLDGNKKFQLSETVSGGMIFYRAESQSSITLPHYYQNYYYTYNNNILISGRTFGATLGISAEYYISPSISIGFGGSFLWGLLKKVDIEQKASNGDNYSVTDAQLNKALKISRIDYSLAFSIHF